VTTGLHRDLGGSVIDVRLEAAAGVVVGAAVLGVLAVSPGLGTAGWATGLTGAVLIAAALTVARLRETDRVHRPADFVTLIRGVLAADIAALVADSWDGALPVTATVTVASVALPLDWLDGQVARRTGTSSALGARFDQEVDAFLILVLSVYVSTQLGPWVLLIGGMRYAFVAAARFAPWLNAPLPPSFARKTVAAIQGIVLLLAGSGLLPGSVNLTVVLLALGSLLWSFGRDVRWLWRTWRRTRAARAAAEAATPGTAEAEAADLEAAEPRLVELAGR
jgi:phosphatidylglycerophosphate synthase